MKLILLSAFALLAFAQDVGNHSQGVRESRGIQLGNQDKDEKDEPIVRGPRGIGLGFRQDKRELKDEIESDEEEHQPILMRWLSHGRNSGIEEIDDNSPALDAPINPPSLRSVVKDVPSPNGDEVSNLPTPSLTINPQAPDTSAIATGITSQPSTGN